MTELLKLPTPPPREGATWEDYQRYRAEIRACDRERIARGLAIPEEVQRENSATYPSRSSKHRILKYPEA